MSNTKGKVGTRTLTEFSIMAAVIVVLTVLANFIRFGPFSISLVLCPIIVGAALHGPIAGAMLGAIFGFVVIITGIFGWDGGTVMLLMSANPLGVIVICMVKGFLAGYLAGLVYRLFEKKSTKLAVVISGITAPVVNTGTFVLLMLVFYKDILASWAGGSDMLTYIITGLCGINFLIELIVNLVLAAAVTSLIKYFKKRA